MTFPRAYAPQLPVSQAIAELRNCAGSQFDPAVVDAIANLVIGLVWPPERSTASDSHLERAMDRSGAEAGSTQP
jgi:HD-GYP domain-containing protein (c-di-GMP phosphodiesterase class II)